MEPVVAQATKEFSIAHAFSSGGPVMYVIAFVGLLTLWIVIERFIAFKSLIINKKDFSDNLYGMVLRGDLRQAIAYCDSRPAPLSSTVKAGLVQALNKRPDEEIQVAMDAAVLRENPRFEGWISFLAVTGNVSVLSGLLGTIIGMIRSFASVADADQATKAQELSKGISEALNCTAFGLLVSILAIVAYGFFQMRVQKAENDVIESSMTVLNLVVANRDKMKD